MKLALTLTVMAVAAGALRAPAASAQSIPHPFRFGTAAGMSVPSRGGSSALETGFHMAGMLGFKPPVLPLGLRAELMYHRFGLKGVGGNSNVFAGLINATYDVSPSPLITPYLITGVGVYHTSLSGAAEAEQTTHLGLNAGTGLRFDLPGVSPFVEARYHFVRGGTDLVPFAFGVRF